MTLGVPAIADSTWSACAWRSSTVAVAASVRAGDLPRDLDVVHQVVEVGRVERHDGDVEIAEATLPLVAALDRQEQVGLEPHHLFDVRIDAEVAGPADLLDVGGLGRVVVERPRDAHELVAETEREHDLGHRGRERHDPLRRRVDRHRLAVVVGDRDRERGRRAGRRRRSRDRRRDGGIVAAGRDEQRQGEQRQHQGGADGSHARLLSCEGRPVGSSRAGLLAPGSPLPRPFPGPSGPSGSVGFAPRSQWRDRAGFSPASLFATPGSARSRSGPHDERRPDHPEGSTYAVGRMLTQPADAGIGSGDYAGSGTRNRRSMLPTGSAGCGNSSGVS